MKKFFKTDSFVDYKGVERPFTLCAIVNKDTDLMFGELSEWTIGEVSIGFPSLLGAAEVEISIGFSIVHASDIKRVDEAIGKKIAEGRAEKKPFDTGIFTNAKILNNKVVNALLDNYAFVMKTNPGAFIEGYDQMKERYLQKELKDESFMSSIPSTNLMHN